MLVSKDETTRRSAEGVELWNYLTAESGTSISVAYAELSGEHPETISEKTDRCYIFISGNANVRIENEEYEVGIGDVVYVQKGKRHSLKGIACYYVINNPPYKRSRN